MTLISLWQIHGDRATVPSVLEDLSIVFFSSRRRHTRYWRDWSSDVCSSDLDKRPTGRVLKCFRLQGETSMSKETRDRSLRDLMDERGVGAILLSSPANFAWYTRSEERRVGKECRSRWSPYH